ncbi:MAG: MATE family efflux transporter [Eubacteriales bacterium]|nr:MATE family efflux transporter [Eubacteriales bacterium]
MTKRSDERLGTEPITSLMLRMAAPTLTAQLVNILYNMVDRIYIGHIPEVGSLAIAGLGLCAPVLHLVTAFSDFVGRGGSPKAAIALGRKDREQAERVLGNGFIMLLFFSLVLTLGFQFFRRPILFAFGAGTDTIAYAEGYISIYLCGTIFVMLTLGLNPFIVCQGRSRTAMFSVLIGAGINVILDPIFIYGLNMGVKGAALATVISQCLSTTWILCFLCSKRASLRLRLSRLRPDWTVMKQIASLGVSPFMMQATESMTGAVLNVGLKTYGGDLYVSALIVMDGIMRVGRVSVKGFNSGVQPIISYNYGAEKYDRVRGTIRRMVLIGVGFESLYCAALMLFPEVFARVFSDDPELTALVAGILPIFVCTLWMFGILSAVQASFLALSQAKQSMLIACIRKLVFLIPLSIILPRFWGVMSIYWAEPISDGITAVVSVLLFLPVWRRLCADRPLDGKKKLKTAKE